MSNNLGSNWYFAKYPLFDYLDVWIYLHRLPIAFSRIFFCQITMWRKKAQFKHHCNFRFLTCAHCNFTENKLSFDMRNWTRNFFCQITTFESGHCNFPEFFIIWLKKRACARAGFFVKSQCETEKKSKSNMRCQKMCIATSFITKK